VTVDFGETVDIACAVLDGARFLPDLVKSLQSQTHTTWRLWVRDDGSTDGSSAVIRSAAARDSRIHLLHTGGPPAGAARAFGWLLERLPAASSYVMFADQDDVWLPPKIEHTLAAMRAAEADAPPGTPVLVHTDLIVVDEALGIVDPSFWDFAGISPDPVALRRFVVQPITTGATAMLNRALRTLVGSVPAEAILHDWWCALVAAAFGRVVAVNEATVLYRQHGGNAVGARDPRIAINELPTAIVRAFAKTAEVRRGIAQTAAQARAFLERYGDRLTVEDRAFLDAYSRIPEQRFLRRKMNLLRYRALPEHGTLRRLGIVLRG